MSRSWPLSVHASLKFGWLLAIAAGLHTESARAADQREAVANRHAVLQRVRRHFDLVDFYKPRRGDPIDFSYYLSPLICQEVLAGSAAPHGSFGSVVREAPHQFRVDSQQPTVYAERRSVVVDGCHHDQLIFVWCYDVSTAGELTAQGVRMTLDRKGFPAVLEVLTDSSGLRLIFVSLRLEKAAAAQYGPPPSGCRYSVERSRPGSSKLLVARVIDDGPAPMGPYVYLDAAAHDVVNLRCRCATLQARRFRRSIPYRFLPLSDLRLLGFRIDFASGTARLGRSTNSEDAGPAIPETQPSAAPYWARRLRLPSSF
ncbi:MAG TPA: hypothetical protein EYP14_18075 [Planctomycetaceae bacterium]|nr:hypothetical protein [Planctomycetaceae bacterium]